MKCPYCGHLGDKVVDSRESREGDVIRRRRQCPDCGKRFTSRERIEEIEYRVVKKDGNREPFQRQKLIAYGDRQIGHAGRIVLTGSGSRDQPHRGVPHLQIWRVNLRFDLAIQSELARVTHYSHDGFRVRSVGS